MIPPNENDKKEAGAILDELSAAPEPGDVEFLMAKHNYATYSEPTLTPIGIMIEQNKASADVVHEEQLQSTSTYEVYPNPFNPATIIRYQVPFAARVSVQIFDMLGRDVQTLVDRELAQGAYTVRFDGTGLASGMYFARISIVPRVMNEETGPVVQTIRMMLAK